MAIHGEPTSEGNIIPQHWNFPERKEKGLRVNQIDMGLNYLAVSTTPLPKDARNIQADYFFDSQGNPLHYRRVNIDGAGARIVFGGDIPIRYEIKNPANSIPKKISIHFSQEVHAASDITNPIVDIGSVSYETRDPPYTSFGKVFSFALALSQDEAQVNSDEWSVGVASLHTKIEKEYNMNAYTAEDFQLFTHSLGPGMSEEILRDYPWRVKPLDPNAEKPTEFCMFYKGKPMFILRWHIRNGIFVMEQQYLGEVDGRTGLTKQFFGPLSFNQEEVISMAFAPAYRDSISERLIVPWENVRGATGTTLSYNFPRNKDEDQSAV